MGEELEVVEAESRELVIPGSFEIVDLDEPAQVAAALKGVDAVLVQLRNARRILADVILEERARRGENTLMLGGSTVVVTPGSPEIEWDMDELEKLRDAGLPEERWDEMVTETVSTKVSATVAKQIAKTNPDYAVIIGRARIDHEKGASVKVT